MVTLSCQGECYTRSLRGLECFEKPCFWKKKFNTWNSLDNGQIGLIALKIIKWALKIVKSSLKFSEIQFLHCLAVLYNFYQNSVLCVVNKNTVTYAE